ncbi:hypothetical protein ACIRD3_05700 [Kitasatospora sp. NPDC093550]|uniref:hypothetical protein n=1 Tax=Kitasatospora sp. NPDC093550 TaxID=3364089 RepID=UPI003827B75D
MKSLAAMARWGISAVAAGALLALASGAAEAAGPMAGSEATIAVGQARAVPIVSPDGTRAYVATADGQKRLYVKAVDTRTDEIVGQVAVGYDDWLKGLALSPDGSQLYLLNASTLTVVDTASLTVLHTTTVPDQPRPDSWTAGETERLALSPDGATLYISQDGPHGFRAVGNGRILTFATAQRGFTGSVEVPTVWARGLAVRPDGRGLYVGGSSGVVRLDTAGAVPTVVRTIPDTATALGTGHDLALTPDGRRLLAVNATGSGQGELIDTATDTPTAHLTLTGSWAGLGNPRPGVDGTRFYVTTGDTDSGASVLALDAATGAVVPAETVTGLDEVWVNGLAVGPDGHTFYAGGYVKDVDSVANLQIIPF